MHKNPFLFKPVPVDSLFCDRKEILQELKDLIKNSTDVVLSSPRRYGKTSLVRRVLHQLGGKYLTIYVSFERLDSERDAAARIAKGVYSAFFMKESTLERGLRLAKKALTSFSPSMQVGADGTPSFSAVPLAGMEGRELLEHVLEDLHIMAEKLENKIVMAFDEFQEITRLPRSDGVEGLLRTHIQFQHFSHIFIGSRRAVLREMFENPKRSFFKSAVIKPLARLPVHDLIKYYSVQFHRAGKRCPKNIATEMAERSHGYGFYAQQYGYFTFGASGEKATQEAVQAAAYAILEQAKPGFEMLLNTLPVNQIRLLKALAREPTSQLTAADFGRRHSLISSNTAYARKVLVEQDHIEKGSDGMWRIVDPVLCEWLRG